MTSSTTTFQTTLTQAPTRKRSDIQGLRALAVALVIGYHFFPTMVPGGFVGVDVFFVISGYLITLLLLREHERTGTISLAGFYVRRVRRLMPAALATTATTVALAWFVVDPVRLTTILHDASWTGAYLANVHFAQQPGGYFASGEHSPLLHFWSLAVEEQYYLLWPALLLGLTKVARRRLGHVVPVFLLAVIVVSLVASVNLTDSGSSHAYYSLGTRAWELAIGCVTAWAVFRGVTIHGSNASNFAVWVGLGMVLLASASYTEATPFPGYSALLPTLGAGLAILAGTNHFTSANRVLRIPAVQVIGNASYSLYLWHWPVLVLGAMLVGSSRFDRVGLVAVTVVLGLASHRWIERPTAHLGTRWRPRKFLLWVLVVTLCAISIPALTAARVSVTGGHPVDPLGSLTASATLRDGVITVQRTRPLAPPERVPSNISPTLADLPDDLAAVFTNGCFSHHLIVCEGGDPDGVVQVVLAGDSHAGQWWPGLERAAQVNGWKLYMVGKNGCPLADVRVGAGDLPAPWPDCDRWQRNAVETIQALRADVVLYDNHAQGYTSKSDLADDFEGQWTTGVESALDALTKRSTVVAFGQTPSLEFEPGVCLGSNLAHVARCSMPTHRARLPFIMELSERLARQAGALYFDPANLLCRDTCPTVDHNVLMYRDSDHLTATYSTALAEPLAEVVRAALRERGD